MTPVNNDKLTVKHIPLSVSNDEIKRMLEEHGVSLRSQIKYGLIRDSDGHQTTFKSGDRFVYVKPFDPPLARNQKVGNYSCVVIHHGKEIPCVVCGITGHKVGDLGCKALLFFFFFFYFVKVYCEFTYTCSHYTLKNKHLQSTNIQHMDSKLSFCKHLG